MNEKQFFDATKQRALRGAYLLHGAEEYTKQEAVDRVVSLLDPSLRDMNLVKLDAPDWQALTEASEQLPFFDELRVVLISGFKDKELTEGAQAFEKIRGFDPIERLIGNRESILLFLRRGSGGSSEFQKRMQQADRAVEFAELDEDRCVQMVKSRTACKGTKIDGATARLLVEMVGTDGYRLKNEIDKVCDYVGTGNVISSEAIRTVVTPSVEYNAFTMFGAFLSGNKKNGMRILQTVLNSGEENPMRVASFLSGRLRLMLMAREMLDAKRPKAEILARLGGNPKAAEIAVKNAQSLNTAKLRAAVAAFSEVNALVKQGELRDTDALALAIFRSF